MSKKIGIYLILNKINQKIYVGQSRDIMRRWSKHRTELHLTTHLVRAFLKYGLENFQFVVLEYCPIYKLNTREIYWVKAFKATNPKYGYNKISGGGVACTFSSDLRATLSKARKQYLSDRENLEQLRDQFASLKTDPTVEAKRVRNLGASRRTAAARRQTSKISKELWKSEKHRHKVSASIKSSWSDPEIKAKHMAARAEAKAEREAKGEKFIFITDGINNKRITANPSTYIIPDGWKRGTTKKSSVRNKET